jgi:putative phage-type endonuclease
MLLKAGAESYVTEYPSREAWLEGRKGHVGGSDVAALFGVNPYKSAYELWAEKSGLIDASVLETEAMFWGKALEPFIASRYREVTGRETTLLGLRIYRPAACEHLGTTPDAEVVDPERDEPGVLSIKNVTQYKANDWEDEPPVYYQIQLQAELAATGASWGSFGVLIGGNKFHWLDVKRNDRFIELLFERVRDFKRRVDEQDAPPVDGSERTYDALKKLYAGANGETVSLGESMLEIAAEFEAMKKNVASITKQIAERKNQLLAAMGSASLGLLPDGSGYSRSVIEKQPYTVTPKSYVELRRRPAK